MQEKYYCFTFDKNDEIFTAMLSQFPFESFEEEEAITKAYIAEIEITEEFKSDLNILCNQFEVNYTSELLPDVNWNEAWEASFEPVEVEKFVRVKAVFHPEKEGFEHTIIIDPKMSFGTGHHETTYLMMDQMQHIDVANKSVLDFGCGTGILSILAKKMNADSVVGVDIEAWAYHNAMENKQLNNVDSIDFILGDITKVPDSKYDIILANITKNILLESLEGLNSHSKKGTTLLLSGILENQLDEIINAYTQDYFQIISYKQKGKWLCAKFMKI